MTADVQRNGRAVECGLLSTFFDEASYIVTLYGLRYTVQCTRYETQFAALSAIASGLGPELDALGIDCHQDDLSIYQLDIHSCNPHSKLSARIGSSDGMRALAAISNGRQHPRIALRRRYLQPFPEAL